MSEPARGVQVLFYAQGGVVYIAALQHASRAAGREDLPYPIKKKTAQERLNRKGRKEHGYF